MSRGAGWLAAGVLLVIVSLCGGSLLQQSAVESFKRARGPDEAFDTVSRLSPWASIVNLAFYGGLLACLIGIVVLIVDSGRPAPPPPSHSPPRSTAASVEDENRRLREELERARRERAGDGGGERPPPA